MATKIPVAQKRMFENVFVCKDCNKRIRAHPVKIIAKKIKCNKCGSHNFRPIRKK